MTIDWHFEETNSIFGHNPLWSFEKINYDKIKSNANRTSAALNLRGLWMKLRKSQCEVLIRSKKGWGRCWEPDCSKGRRASMTLGSDFLRISHLGCARLWRLRLKIFIARLMTYLCWNTLSTYFRRVVCSTHGFCSFGRSLLRRQVRCQSYL